MRLIVPHIEPFAIFSIINKIENRITLVMTMKRAQRREYVPRFFRIQDSFSSRRHEVESRRDEIVLRCANKRILQYTRALRSANIQPLRDSLPWTCAGKRKMNFSACLCRLDICRSRRSLSRDDFRSVFRAQTLARSEESRFWWWIIIKLRGS